MTDDPRLQPYRVDVVGFDTALAELRSVRDEVFVGEQGVPITLEHDALDPLCTHVLARLLDDKPMPVRDKGPLFIIYPFDADETLRSERYYSRSAWQLKVIEVE